MVYIHIREKLRRESLRDKGVREKKPRETRTSHGPRISRINIPLYHTTWYLICTKLISIKLFNWMKKGQNRPNFCPSLVRKIKNNFKTKFQISWKSTRPEPWVGPQLESFRLKLWINRTFFWKNFGLKVYRQVFYYKVNLWSPKNSESGTSDWSKHHFFLRERGSSRV